eukprot:comp24062_c0_seq1/m.43231 comp24062_c0_seq1/g.43231  ORF comp24062_c0_seq1/g.43231 comp24062_c0_seq1/m.43231 type:complete len:572 (-) comp24062_c0_seq1:354-2069(-)
MDTEKGLHVPVKSSGYSRRCKIFTVAGVVGVALVIAAAVTAGVVVSRNSSSDANTGDNTTSTIAPIPPTTDPFTISTTEAPLTTTVDHSSSTQSSFLPTTTIITTTTTNTPISSTTPPTTTLTPTPTLTTTTTTTTTTSAEPTCAPLSNCASQMCSGGVAFCTQCNAGYELQNGKCLEPAASCPVVAVDKVCYSDLSSAITAAGSGSVVTIFQDLTINAEIPFAATITIQGNPSASTQPRLLCTMNITWAGMLRATGDGQTVTLKNLAFENVGGGSCTAFRTPDLGADAQPAAPTTTVNLNVYGCSFKNFETYARGGSAIFVGSTNGINVDSCVFDSNVVHNYGMNGTEEILWWMGGGAVWIVSVGGQVTITNNVFTNNTFWFPHSLGAALMISSVFAGSTVKVESNQFKGNMASAGGAFYLGNIEAGAKLTVNSTFESNEAREFGWKSRGGAMWLEQVHGEVLVYGTFRNNTAPAGRGGAIANNIVVGNVTLDAQFIDNSAASSGSIWDSWSSQTPVQGTGTVSILGTSLVQGNTAGNNALMYFNGGGQTWSLTTFTPGQTVVFSSNGMQ